MSEAVYPEMGEKVILDARVVGVRKHDVPSHRTVTVQLSDGQGIVTNLNNIKQVKREEVEAKAVQKAPENKAVPGPKNTKNR